MQSETALLSAVEVSKTFGGVRALNEVSFDVNRGEIVGLVGDNGAGKSTVISVLMGVFRPDSGKITFNGEETLFASPRDARKAGIEPVYQQASLVDLMCLWRNFFLGREITHKLGPFRLLDKRAMKKASMAITRDIGVGLRTADESVSFLSGGERQAICIGRSMHFDAKLLLLDEPTAALSVKESQRVLQFAEESRDRGVSVIIVDHNIHHIYPIVDKFVVLDRGKKVAELAKNKVTPEEIIRVITTGRYHPQGEAN